MIKQTSVTPLLSHHPSSFSFLLTSLPLSPPVLSSQTAALTCVTGTASAPWDSRVGIVNARQAGGAPAAVLPWRPPALTTRTTKEVNWRERDRIWGRTVISAALNREWLLQKKKKACERNKSLIEKNELKQEIEIKIEVS